MGWPRNSLRTPLWPCTALILLVAGCGDSGGGSDSASASSTGTDGAGSSTSTTELVPTTGDSGESATTDGVGESMTGSTTSPTAPTTTNSSETATGTATDTSTSETTAGDTSTGGTTGTDTTTGGPGVCEDPELTPGEVMVDAACTIEQMVGTWKPKIEWQNNAVGGMYATPVVANLTDDNMDGAIDGKDIPDIVAANSGGSVFVLSGDGKKQHWKAADNVGGGPSAAIGDLDGDGKPEVVVAGPLGYFAWHGDTGSLFWKNPVATDQPICGGVSVYDIDGDGKPEVVQGARIFNGQTGALRGTGAVGKGTGHSNDVAHFGVAADLDQDGKHEVVVGNAAYDADGKTLWSTAEHDGFVAIGNFDDDALAEVVVAWYPGMVRLQDHLGKVIWTQSIGGGTVGPPTIADFDGDGAPEIGVSGTNKYVVLDGDGKVLWTKVVADGSGFTGSSVFDFEGDGKAEVVYADEQDLWVFDGKTGAVKLQESSHASATCSEYPAIADVDNDGHAEIIYGGNGGIFVVGDTDNTWRRSRTAWNQHSYHITNVIHLV